MPTSIARPAAGTARAPVPPAFVRAGFALALGYVCWAVGRMLFMIVPAKLNGIDIDVWTFVKTSWGVWGIATDYTQLALGGLAIALQAVGAAVGGFTRWVCLAASLAAMAGCVGAERFGPGSNVPLSYAVVLFLGLVPGLAAPWLAKLAARED